MNINRSCRSQLRIILKLWNEDGKVKRYHTPKTRRIFALVKADKFLKAYLKVSYGKYKSSKGIIEEFYNDGIYFFKEELLEALSAFIEE